MADFTFSRQFLRELAEWKGRASERDVDELEKTLALIGDNPALSGRVPSFYDPGRPSYLYRVGSVLVHYRVGSRGEVEFLNLFFRRS